MVRIIPAPFVADQPVRSDLVLVRAFLTGRTVGRDDGERGLETSRLLDALLGRDQTERLAVPLKVRDLVTGEGNLTVKGALLEPYYRRMS